MFICVVFSLYCLTKKIRLPPPPTNNFEKDLLSWKILLNLMSLFLPVYMQIYHLSVHAYSKFP